MKELTVTNETMTSSQLAEMLGYDKKEINRKVKQMFNDKIAGGIISPTLRANGQVDNYHLPELESKMFVAKHDINYLELITQYWIDKTKPQEPSWLISLSPEARLAIDDLSKQRDDAIKAKAYINDKRTATLMNKASQDSKRIKKLECKLQDEGDYKSLIAAGLPQRISTELKDNVQTFRILKNISADLELPPIKVTDPRYGEVNTYHSTVINQFTDMYL